MILFYIMHSHSEGDGGLVFRFVTGVFNLVTPVRPWRTDTATEGVIAIETGLRTGGFFFLGRRGSSLLLGGTNGISVGRY